ncbi:hypothetical protein HPB47_021487 [Ixodes persulcatus]|uniref:Uncharacterized protein n=1 Tax=Ixodes persulcatus TaxID=34615 RepID=A0AC60QDG8_IXOPE|nr:hypothetical protein HPB47_021487 [Ixodes persulcatus]
MAAPLEPLSAQAGRKRFTIVEDILLLREVLAMNPFVNFTRWDTVVANLNEALGKTFSVRGVRDRCDLLLGLFKRDDRTNLRKRFLPPFFVAKVTLTIAKTIADGHYRPEGDDWVARSEAHLILSLATTATSATTTPAADPTKPQQKRRLHRKKPTTPPEDPLPPDDFKIVIRPQGGLDLSKTNAAQLADCIFHQTKVTDFAQDQVRINTRSNFIVVSTPDERRAQQYMNLNAITWNATHYPVQSHIPPPSITTSGAIFQIPAEDSEPLIMESLTRHNPTITVLDARRIKDTGIVQVLFLGPHVPFWVQYRAVILRCYPYKRKTEACMACWSAGHRRDVCPKPSPKPHCTICGTLGPTPNHPCQPHCILCGQDHLTGAAGCPKRFQPRRTLPKILPNILPTTPGTGPDRTTTTFTTLGLTYSQAAQGQTMNAYKRKTVSLNSNSKPHTTLQPHIPIS